MTALRDLLDPYVKEGAVPGAVALLARGDDVTVEAVGSQAVDGAVPMARDSIFRIASLTKPITAAAVMLLVDEGRVGLEDPIGRWLPELAAPMVVRTPQSPLDDVVPARRPITVLDLLTNRAGYGWPSDFSLPQVQALFTVQTDGREVQRRPAPDEWLADLARLPLLYQPGEAWLYDTCSDLQGILVARASGQPLPEFFAERVFAPLGMRDTGFVVTDRDRLTSYYRRDEGGLVLADGPGRRLEPPARVPGRLGRPGGHGRRLAALRPDAPRRRRRAALARGGAADDDRPPHRRPTRGRRAVPGGPGLGVRRFGRHQRGPARARSPAATAGSAAPGRRRTSCRTGGRWRSCSPRSAWTARCPATLFRDFWTFAAEG